MIHPHASLKFIDESIGYGVFATKLIPKGTVTWTLCQFDQKCTPEELKALPPAYQEIMEKYSYDDGKGSWILCWDFGRFMNHHCEANTLALDDHYDVAVRDILPGEQITCEYSMLNLQWDLDCHCSAKGCRKKIKATDKKRYGSDWSEQVSALLPLNVEQPLLPFMLDPHHFQTLAFSPRKSSL